MNKIEKLLIPQPNGDIDINKVELYRHKNLKKYFTKGKTKESVDKLMFIYLMSDIGSMYYHLPYNERYEAVKNHFGYDDMWNAPPDLKLAIDAYADCIEVSASGKAYSSGTRAVYQTGRDLDAMMEMVGSLKSALHTRINDVMNNTAFSESEKLQNIKEAQAFILEIATTQKAVIDNIKQLPTLLNTVKDLATKFAEEGNTSDKVYGGGELGNRE